LGNARIKVTTVILTCAKRFGKKQKNGDLVIQILLTHKNIASLSGLTRETTTLEIEKLKKEKIITYKNRLLVIKNLAKLEEGLDILAQNKSFPDTL
jgi:CRP/FNR family transcriptional regulator